jgi:hypothetical protein
MIVIVAMVFSYLIMGVIGCETGDGVTAPPCPVSPTPTVLPPTPTPTVLPPTPTPTTTPIWPPITPTPCPTVTVTVLPPVPCPTPKTIILLPDKKLYPKATPDCVEFEEVFDLTKCEICISYTLDMSCINPDTDKYGVKVQVGLKDKTCKDCFNPIGEDCCPCAGWMTSTHKYIDQSYGYWEGIDLHYLQSKPDDKPWHYDWYKGCVRPPIVDCFDKGKDYLRWFGFWFDRDSVCHPCEGIYGMEDGKTYNTGGKYFIEIRYKALDCGLGYMLASINGVPQGFYFDKDGKFYDLDCPWPDRVPDFCPIGKTFLADMTKLQPFVGVGLKESCNTLEDFGYVTIKNLKITGCPVECPVTPTPTCTLPSCP